MARPEVSTLDLSVFQSMNHRKSLPTILTQSRPQYYAVSPPGSKNKKKELTKTNSPLKWDAEAEERAKKMNGDLDDITFDEEF